MKTYEIVIRSSEESVFIKTDASSEAIQSAIDFIPDTEVDKLLQALRIQGFKATQIKLDPVDVFEI